MEKALNMMGLARKAGLIELGEEPVGAAARVQRARLLVVASDASDHTRRRAKSFVAGTNQQCITVPFTKDELGMAVGRENLALAAFTDPAMALNFVKALPEQEKFAPVLASLSEQTERIAQRRKEEKAHRRNVKTGKTRVTKKN